MARRTLSKEVKEGILRDLAAGVKPADVAKTWGISIPSVYNYKKRAAAAAAAAVVPVATEEVR